MLSAMKFICKYFFLVITVFLSSPVFSDEAESMDVLFERLRNAPDRPTAVLVENAIWMRWMQSGDEHIDAQLRDAMRRRSSYDFIGALQVLNDIIHRAPDFPEAWNQRATVYFHLQEFEKSLEDVAQALLLEPRHFGAMAGRGVIRYFQGKPVLAARNILQAAELHPYLQELNMFPELGLTPR